MCFPGDIIQRSEFESMNERDNNEGLCGISGVRNNGLSIRCHDDGRAEEGDRKGKKIKDKFFKALIPCRFGKMNKSRPGKSFV